MSDSLLPQSGKVQPGASDGGRGEYARRHALGLGRVRQAVSTGALPQATLDWFREFGIEVETPA